MKGVALRRFRYSVCGLLTITAAVGFVCFWATWPKRTAERFVVDYFRELDSHANPFKEGTPEAVAFEDNHNPQERGLSLVPHRRSIASSPRLPGPLQETS